MSISKFNVYLEKDNKCLCFLYSKFDYGIPLSVFYESIILSTLQKSMSIRWEGNKGKWHYPWYEMLMVIATTVKNWEVIILVCSKHLKEKAYEWAKGEWRCKEKK